jgi:ArsR family transcriptional regulator
MPAAMRSEALAFSVLFKGLSDPTRLRILNLLCENEVCVCNFVSVLGIVQPVVSRHLAYLKRAGLVEARRDGKWMYYRWAKQSNPAAASLTHGLRDWMMKSKGLAAERRKLKNTGCQ